ncbi:MAG: LysM peptidoglycan-binding domain-containing protein [Ilumatobacteraceae bacterium]
MRTASSSRAGMRSAIRFVVALVTLLGIVLGLPLLLAVAAQQRFEHISPLHGLQAPWRWSIEEMRSWRRQLSQGLESSAALVDIFLRLALVVGWVCVAVLVYTVIDEGVFQLRHGMPSSPHRRLGGFGSLGALGRRLATILIAALPLVISASPTLVRAAPRAASGAVYQRVADLPDPTTTILAVPAANEAESASTMGDGWSVVEVKRGDSVWGIAQRIAEGNDVATVAQQIVGANLGTVMSDGHRFSTPALIEPGWLLNVPSAGPAIPIVLTPMNDLPSAGTYVVTAGDSYWGIAQVHLDPSATDGDIATYTRHLIDINAPALGYRDERLIRPGDVVQLGVPAVAPDAQSPTETPDLEVLPVVVTSLTPVVVPVPTSVDPQPPVIESPPTTEAAFLTPPTVVSESAVATISAVVDEWSNNDVPVKRGLAAAVLLSGGAIAVLEVRRRQQLRSARIGARLVPPTLEAIETEVLLRSLTPADRLARVDLALRSSGPDLAHQHARAVAIEVAEDGDIRLYTDRLASVVARHWILDIDAGAWRLPAAVSLTDLADTALGLNQPCPAIVHIGETAGGDLFMDLEAVGVLSIDAEPGIAASIVRYAAASLAVSPFAESSRIFTVGIEIDAHLGNPCVESYDSVASAAEGVRSTVGSITAATSGVITTFALRVAAHGGEAWEPTLLLSVGGVAPEELSLLASLGGGGGRGVGVMIDRPVVGSAVLRAVDGEFVLEPLGRRITPVGLSVADVVAVDNLLGAADRPLIADLDAVVDVPPTPSGQFADRVSELVVQVLGHVAVRTRTDRSIEFDRSKSQELVVWLSQHRHRPTRTSARTALWDLAVRDATFSNVVSDARRAMARAVAPPAGQEWIGRTLNENLPLHDLIVSDVELLADRVAAARGLAGAEAIAVLRPGVELINGIPFAGTSYLWPDAEGITSALVLLATSAAADLAAHYLAVGDVEGVFWSTGRGLQVLAGHEELIALRMRAHALRGDLAGVRSEWDSYERAVHADSWAAAEPSPKLIELRRRLLSPSLAS